MPASVALREIADIDGEQHVGRAVAPLGLDALDQTLLGEDHIDLDAGLVGERLEQRIDQVRLAVGIDIDLASLGGLGARRGEEGKRSASAKARASNAASISSNGRGSRPRYRTASFPQRHRPGGDILRLRLDAVSVNKNIVIELTLEIF